MIGTSFFTQERRIDILEEFGHVVEVSRSKSKRKRSVTALKYLQDYMNTIKNEPCKWEDLEYAHMLENIWGSFLLTLVSIQGIDYDEVSSRQY